MYMYVCVCVCVCVCVYVFTHAHLKTLLKANFLDISLILSRVQELSKKILSFILIQIRMDRLFCFSFVNGFAESKVFACKEAQHSTAEK